jgi:predicted ATP-grasp superfamily ATP-dependent carboligase
LSTGLAVDDRVSGNEPPALILGDDPINALGVARNLGRSGIEVHRLGGSRPQVLRSRYIRSTWVVPGIDDSRDEDFVHALKRVAPKLGDRAVVFPISDLHVLKVSRSAAALSESFRLLDSGRAATETLVNKRRFYESLARMDVPHPRSRFPKQNDEFEAAAAEIGYPVLLKPEISPLFARRFGRKGFVAHDRDELVRHLKTLETSGLRTMVQEIIPGGPTHMHGCAGFRTADTSLVFCYRRVREFPEGFGCGSLLTSVPSFVDQTRLLEYLDDIGYTGIFDAEFKLDPRDEIYKVIEINARSWWQNTHPSVSGLNLVKAAYDHAVGRSAPQPSYDTNTKWIHLYNDFFAARSSGLGLREWIRSLRGTRSFDIWAGDDVWPMIAYLSEIVSRKILKTLRLRRG